jgi:hypothetical protein
MVRGHGSRRPDGLGRGCQFSACQVLDVRLDFRAWSNAVTRKWTRTSGCSGSTKDREGRLLAWWLG